MTTQEVLILAAPSAQRQRLEDTLQGLGLAAQTFEGPGQVPEGQGPFALVCLMPPDGVAWGPFLTRCRLAPGTHRAPVLMLTDVQRADDAIEAGADDVLLFETSPGLWVRRIEHMLKLNATRREDALIRFYEQSPGLLHAIDGDRRIVTVSDDWLQALGYQRHEVVGQPSKRFMAQESIDLFVHSYLKGFLTTGRCHEVPCRMIRKDGSILETVMSGSARWDAQGRFMHTLAMLTDITKRNQYALELEDKTSALERAHQSLDQAQHELEQFTYVASHDLKSPLRSISNLATWLSEDIGEGDLAEVPAHLEHLKSRVRSVERFIDDLRTYSRVGRLDGQPEDIVLGALLEEVLEDIELPAHFTAALPSTPVTLYTSRRALTEVFGALLRNAVEHHQGDQGLLLVTACVSPDGAFTDFTVEDNGPGIAPNFRQWVFKPFQRLGQAHAESGSGMGLALVKKYVEARGGHVHATDRPNHQPGACIAFRWPNAARPTKATQPSPAPG